MCSCRFLHWNLRVARMPALSPEVGVSTTYSAASYDIVGTITTFGFQFGPKKMAPAISYLPWLIMILRRESGDWVYGLWQYEVLNIRKVLQCKIMSKENNRQIWVMYTDINKAKTNTRDIPFQYIKLTHQLSFRNIYLKVDHYTRCKWLTYQFALHALVSGWRKVRLLYSIVYVTVKQTNKKQTDIGRLYMIYIYIYMSVFVFWKEIYMSNIPD